MAVAQEIFETKFSESDMRLDNEAEEYVRERENASESELRKKPEITKDFIDLITYFTGASKEDVEKKMKESPDDYKKAYTREMWTKLLAGLKNAPDNIGDLENVIENASPVELEEALKEIMKKGTKINASISMVVKLLKMFKGGAIISRVLDLEKKFGITGLNESLSKLPPDVIAFLSKISKKKLRALDYVHLVPILVKMMKGTGDEETGEDGYLNFTQDLSKVDIIDATHAVVKNKKKALIRRATTNLEPGCLENDLIVMSCTNTDLYKHMTDSFAEVLAEQTGKKTAFKTDIEKFNQIRSQIVEIGKKLKARDKEIETQMEKSKMTQEESDKAIDLSRKDNINANLEEKLNRIDAEIRKIMSEPNPSAADHERLAALSAEREALAPLRDAAPDINSAMSIVAQRIRDIDVLLAPYEKKKIEQTITVEEMQSMYDLLNRRSMLVQQQNDYMLGADRSSVESPWNPSEESLMRKVAIKFNNKRTEIIRLSKGEANLTEAQKKDIRLLRLAERFLMNNRGLDSFMKDYYQVTLNEEMEMYVNKIEKDLGRKMNSEERYARQQEIEQNAAVMTRKSTEAMLQNIIVEMYTPTIEAGGEPDMPFNQAVQFAKTSMGYNPKMLVNVISRILTGYKTMAAQLADNDTKTYAGLFASPDIPHSHEKRLRSGENKRAIHQRVDMVFGTTGSDIKRFMNSIEREFETFERVIEGSYTLRYQTNLNDGKYYEHLLNEDAAYIRSDTFDITHIMEGGDVASKYLPGLKAVMDDFFAERGWYLMQELERDPHGHDITIFKVFKEYIEEYYPELSENEQRKYAQVAFQQGYSHGYFQQMISRMRMVGGFVGKSFHRANANHNPHFNAFMFANTKVSNMMDNKHWGRGTRVMPANYNPGDYWDAGYDKTGKTESIDHTIPYGALIQFGTDDFGHFLTYTDEHFENTEGKGMTPFNIFQTGSDDNYRGWRQINKSIGNVSTHLWDRAPYKDDIKLTSSYKGADHYTLIWKSVENIGINYVRSWIGDMVKVKVDAKGDIKEKAKLEHFLKFLYRRYFQEEGIGKKILQDIAHFSGVNGEGEFWFRFESLAKADPSEAQSILNNVLYAVYTTMLAERNPLTLINKTTKWTTQTGVTLYDQIRQSEFASLNEIEYRQIRRDLLTVQTEARGRVTEQAGRNRRVWESGSFDRNIYGDFSLDKSSVSITGKENDRGYVITQDTIEAVLREQLSKNNKLSSEEIDRRVANAKKLHASILSGFTAKVALPDYDKLSNYLSANAIDAYKKTEPFKKIKDEVASRMRKDFEADGRVFDEDAQEAVIEAEAGKIFGAQLAKNHIGKDAAEYEAKYGDRLKTHSAWFMDLWKGGYFGMEPENDYSEYFTTYRNADKDHLWRMAGMTEFTSNAAKKFLDDPDSEKSIETAVKDFAKDPFKAVDKMAEYLNPFRKVIENELGKEMSGRYVNYYTLMCIDMALKEDKYRSGPGPQGWAGMFRDAVEALTGGTRKQSAGADRYQNFTSKSLTSAEAYKVARYMWEKKLLNPEGFEAVKKRMRATIPDIIFEKMPYFAIFLMIALFQQAVVKPAQEQVLGKKK